MVRARGGCLIGKENSLPDERDMRGDASTNAPCVHRHFP